MRKAQSIVEYLLIFTLISAGLCYLLFSNRLNSIFRNLENRVVEVIEVER